jgi:hypothetical protein
MNLFIFYRKEKRLNIFVHVLIIYRINKIVQVIDFNYLLFNSISLFYSSIYTYIFEFKNNIKLIL